MLLLRSKKLNAGTNKGAGTYDKIISPNLVFQVLKYDIQVKTCIKQTSKKKFANA